MLHRDQSLLIFEYTGAKQSRKELAELLGLEITREHEEHLKESDRVERIHPTRC